MVARKKKKITAKKVSPKKVSKKTFKKKVAKKVKRVKKITKTSTRKVTGRKTSKTKIKKRVAKKVVRRKTKRKSRAKVVKKHPIATALRRSVVNPIMGPTSDSFWESEAVFNPAAVLHAGRIHLFYRALGRDGISRVGYASSEDGIHFDERLPYPVFASENVSEALDHRPYTSPARLTYDVGLNVSGGGWGGCEDPRTTKIDERIYMTFNVFNGWYSMRIAFTSIDANDLRNGRWNWTPVVYLSPYHGRHKNWVLFPEKINGKYAIFHNLYDPNGDKVQIEYVDELNVKKPLNINSQDPHHLPNREVAWHNRTRSVGPPPLKTDYGWLVFYHAHNQGEHDRYKVGALILDLKDPTKVIYRSKVPLMEPDEWYENDWKPGIIYVSGAVVKDGTLFLYYGAGDKHVAVAHTNFQDFIKKLRNNEHSTFSTGPLKKKS